MRVTVDPDRCEGHRRCEAAAPTVFKVDDDADLAHVLEERPGEELRAAVERAARVCPRQAITITEENVQTT